MDDIFTRTRLVLGDGAVEKLKSASVCVIGLGGVGGACVEGLARSGVGKLTVVDRDIFEASNLNRQILSTTKTIGKRKCDVAKERIEDINPDCAVTAIFASFSDGTLIFSDGASSPFDFTSYDYVVDAVDDVQAKMSIISGCKKAGVHVISSMGAGNKTDPTKFKVVDIYSTTADPLAKVMRKKLREAGVDGVKVVYSEEKPKKVEGKTVGSVSFVPPVAGYILAGEVIKDIANK